MSAEAGSLKGLLKEAAKHGSVLSPANYKFLQQQIYRHSGIVLDEDKHYLFESRLMPVARAAGLPTLNELCNCLRSRVHAGLAKQVMEALTTNETLFFRDMAPFETLKNRILPELMASLPAHESLNIWSAAASSGQEAYSIAMLVRERGVTGRETRILGTDVSEHILDRARAAKYVQFEVNRGLPATYLVKYFTRDGLDWLLKEEIRSMVTFRPFDLRRPMAELGRFHIIFCRNVLIYFDLETKNRVLQQLLLALEPGGYLFLGSAESLYQVQDRFEQLSDKTTLFYRKK